MNDYNYTITMDVRDYECDMQGVVNNSVYQNYLEHARHEYLKSLDIDFAELSRQNINLVVVRAELDYKLPLISGDRFNIGINMLRESKVRFAFYQNIYRDSDNKLVMKAKIIGTALNQRGRPEIPEALDRLLEQPA
ncbi:MAG: acyl-CoA thioesterase [Gammaproteobacteria bacterium]|nr:acyl-CoA thioesterase [Gammaproteobacteria bacterium]